MKSPRRRSQLPMIIDALGRPETDPTVRRLIAHAGGEPVAVRDRSIEEPVRRSRRLQFAAGTEVIVHDDAVVAVVLHLTPTPSGTRAADLTDWVPRVANDATLADLEKAFGGPVRFSGLSEPYVAHGGAYVRFAFRVGGDTGGWQAPGNLRRITFTLDRPGSACRPEDDDCPACSDLLVRHPTGGVDVEATTTALSAAVAAGDLTEDDHWVRLVDLLPLHVSGLMARVESQLSCTTCHRISCLTLFRNASATFGHHVYNDTRQRPLEAIPPVEQWGDAARIAADQGAMHHVDHEPGGWFLLEQQGVLYLDARYVVSSMVDDSALIRLDDAEVEAHRAGGHAYLSELARRINDDGPHRENSPYRGRDLYRGPDAKTFRAAVRTATVNHTWLARQRQAAAAAAEDA
ncbi:hypothetical protein [Microlunatus sp. Y2014]|uniref:hypothetical protein n=1 Tax=Microlunatus sp. Y2014 TaxID=3418488 RepID=UPI003DA72B68